MQESTVSGRLLDGMAHRVSEVEQRTQPEGFEFVRGNDFRFDLQIAPDDPRQSIRIRALEIGQAVPGVPRPGSPRA